MVQYLLRMGGRLGGPVGPPDINKTIINITPLVFRAVSAQCSPTQNGNISLDVLQELLQVVDFVIISLDVCPLSYLLLKKHCVLYDYWKGIQKHNFLIVKRFDYSMAFFIPHSVSRQICVFLRIPLTNTCSRQYQ